MKKIFLTLLIAPLFLGVGVAHTGAYAQAQADDVYVNNVVIVLDCSGSMRGEMFNSDVIKLDAAKSALKDALKQIPQDVHIGLLQFSAGNTRKEWLYPLGVKKDIELAQAIELPQPGGNTPLGRYMKLGADRLLQEREKQHGYGSYRLIVVTDGESTESPSPVDAYTQDIIARGIIVDAIGVNMDKKHTLATKVHSYRSANNPETLKKALGEIFAEVGGAKDDAAGREVFELIAPVPSEVAAAMLNALTISSLGNHPIGEKPKPKPEPQVQAGQGAQQGGAPAAPAATPISPEKVIGIIILVVIIFVAALGILAKLTE